MVDLAVLSQHLDLRILRGPFQPKRFCDSQVTVSECMEVARPKVNSDPGGKSLILRRHSLFCTQLDSSIPAVHTRPSHAQSMPSEPCCCQHPEHYTGSSSTGCNLSFSRSPLLHLLLQPCIYLGYPQLCQPRAVSLLELSLGHPPLVAALFSSTAPACSRKAPRELTGTSPTTARKSSSSGKL